MHFLTSLAAASSLLSASSLTALAAPQFSSAHSSVPRASTCNSATDRSCWTSGFDINTDYEESIPTTGVTRTYDLTVSEETDWTGPDGVVKSLVMLINGQFPGPVITADWGDTLSITVTNNLKDNGTSMHWHGIRQRNSNLQDGVNGVTECPIPPGSSRTYTFVAEQYGTTWYHSHFSAQYGNGIFGTFIINGPASAPYDIDLGTFPIGDYYYSTADDLVEYTRNNAPPPSDNLLFNGTNIHPTSGAGKYANVSLTHGKSHRLRLVNPSVENHYALSLVNHNFTIIASDLVPVEPLTVTQLFMGPGQRYDIIITADQTIGNYWFNATFSSDFLCGSSENPHPAAIFHYVGASGDLPTDQGTAIVVNHCADLGTLTPVVKRTVPAGSFAEAAANTIPITLDLDFTGPALFTWKVNGSMLTTNWNTPVDHFVIKNNISGIPQNDNIIHVPSASNNSWAFWLIENDPAIGLPHPIHLHGHDFLVVARSDPTATTLQTFDASTVTLNSDNPVRRDVAMLPQYGWLLIAFKIDNPGAWLMHCHIAWHVSGGLGVTFLEDPQTFAQQVSCADKNAFKQNCINWNAYYPSESAFLQTDSGLRRI